MTLAMGMGGGVGLLVVYYVRGPAPMGCSDVWSLTSTRTPRWAAPWPFLEGAPANDNDAPPLDFDNNTAFLFVDKDLSSLIEVLDTQDMGACGHREGRVLDNLLPGMA